MQIFKHLFNSKHNKDHISENFHSSDSRKDIDNIKFTPISENSSDVKSIIDRIREEKLIENKHNLLTGSSNFLNNRLIELIAISANAGLTSCSSTIHIKPEFHSIVIPSMMVTAKGLIGDGFDINIYPSENPKILQIDVNWKRSLDVTGSSFYRDVTRISYKNYKEINESFDENMEYLLNKMILPDITKRVTDSAGSVLYSIPYHVIPLNSAFSSLKTLNEFLPKGKKLSTVYALRLYMEHNGKDTKVITDAIQYSLGSGVNVTMKLHEYHQMRKPSDPEPHYDLRISWN